MIALLAANFARTSFSDDGITVVFQRTQTHYIKDDGTLEPAWAGVKTWPAIILLVIACISAILSTCASSFLPGLTNSNHVVLSQIREMGKCVCCCRDDSTAVLGFPFWIMGYRFGTLP